MLILICVFFETLYIFLSIKSIKKDGGFGLFLGITALNITSGILAGSVFRFVLISALYMVLLKFIYKDKSYFLDTLIINIIFGVKFTAEFVIFITVHKSIENIELWHNTLIGEGLLFIPIIGSGILKKFYARLTDIWNAADQDSGKPFYLRYTLCLTTIVVLMFYFETLRNQIYNK